MTRYLTANGSKIRDLSIRRLIRNIGAERVGKRPTELRSYVESRRRRL